MKNAILSMAALTLLFSCSEQDMVPVEKPVEKGVVSFSFDCGAGKVLTDDFDNAVKTAAVLIYDADGLLLARGDMDSDGRTEARVPLGIGGLKVYAFVNYRPGLFSSFPSETELLGASSALCDAASDYSELGLEMLGCREDVSFHEGENVVVNVERLAAKVSLESVGNALVSRLPISIDEVYLVDAVSACSYSYALAPSGGTSSSVVFAPAKYPFWMYENAGVVLACGETDSVKRSFYCYPNDGGLAPTRLVVAARIDGHPTYYPIAIPGFSGTLSHNTHYRITKLVITGPGVPDPGMNLEKGNVSLTVSIEDWDSGFVQEIVF